MAYDEILADRVRELLESEDDVTEKRMFGGLAFLVAGKMAVAVSREGGLLITVDPERWGALVSKPGVSTAIMGGRPMRGWVRVAAEVLQTKRQLSRWVAQGRDAALTKAGSSKR